MNLMTSILAPIPLYVPPNIADLPQLVYSVGIWFIIGLLLGMLVRFLVNKVAKWLGAGLLVLILLVGLGLVYVNIAAVEGFFRYITAWIVYLFNDVGSIASLNRFTTLALIAGLAMSIYYRAAAKGD